MDELRQKLQSIQESVAYPEPVQPLSQPAPTTVSAPPSSTHSAPVSAERSKKSWPIILVVGACVIIVALLCGWSFYMWKQSSPRPEPPAGASFTAYEHGSAPQHYHDVEHFQQERPKSILKKRPSSRKPANVSFAPVVQVPEQLAWHPTSSI